MVRQLRLSLAPDPYMPDPTNPYDLDLELFELGTRLNVELVFRDVGDLRVPVISGLTQVDTLLVEPNHLGHERRYCVSQLEYSAFSFTCKSVEVIGQVGLL